MHSGVAFILVGEIDAGPVWWPAETFWGFSSQTEKACHSWQKPVSVESDSGIESGSDTRFDRFDHFVRVSSRVGDDIAGEVLRSSPEAPRRVLSCFPSGRQKHRHGPLRHGDDRLCPLASETQQPIVTQSHGDFWIISCGPTGSNCHTSCVESLSGHRRRVGRRRQCDNNLVVFNSDSMTNRGHPRATLAVPHRRGDKISGQPRPVDGKPQRDRRGGRRPAEIQRQRLRRGRFDAAVLPSTLVGERHAHLGRLREHARGCLDGHRTQIRDETHVGRHHHRRPINWHLHCQLRVAFRRRRVHSHRRFALVAPQKRDDFLTNKRPIRRERRVRGAGGDPGFVHPRHRALLPLRVHIDEGVCGGSGFLGEPPQERRRLRTRQNLIRSEHRSRLAGSNTRFGHPRHRRVEIITSHVTELVPHSSLRPALHVPQKQRRITTRHRRVRRKTHTIQTRYRSVTRPLHRLSEIVAVGYITIPRHRTNGGGGGGATSEPAAKHNTNPHQVANRARNILSIPPR